MLRHGGGGVRAVGELSNQLPSKQELMSSKFCCCGVFFVPDISINFLSCGESLRAQERRKRGDVVYKGYLRGGAPSPWRWPTIMRMLHGVCASMDTWFGD